MRQRFSVLRADCADLRAELDLGPALLDALAKAHASDRGKLAALTSRSKRQSYVNGVISLYGLLEESVDQLVIEVSSAYSGIYQKYLDLPEKIREAHRELSLKSLLDAGRVRLREPLDEQAAILALASNANNMPPQLISSVFTYATANYRLPFILELLLRIDVDAKAKVESGAAQSALVASGLIFRNVESLLSDLATRRNDAAHSFKTIDLLDVSTLKAYLDVVQALIEELHNIARERVLRCLTEQQLAPIGKVVNVWTSALGVDMDSGSIEAPCRVILVRNASVTVVDVVTLQSNGSPISGRVQCVSEIIPLGMGFSGLKPSGAAGATVFVLPDKWTYLTLP
jgi:hypothetical protein